MLWWNTMWLMWNVILWKQMGLRMFINGLWAGGHYELFLNDEQYLMRWYYNCSSRINTSQFLGNAPFRRDVAKILLNNLTNYWNGVPVRW